MATIRQDAWNEEDDQYLAEVVLRYIREGGTQLEAFKEVGEKLGRTASACGFRWNSYVRKKFRQNIEEAKQVRKKQIQGEKKEENTVETNNQIDRAINEVIYFLNQLKENKEVSSEAFLVLKGENERLREEVKSLEKKVSLLEKEYRALFDFVDKKRNLVSGEDMGERVLRERDVLLQK